MFFFTESTRATEHLYALVKSECLFQNVFEHNAQTHAHLYPVILCMLAFHKYVYCIQSALKTGAHIQAHKLRANNKCMYGKMRKYTYTHTQKRLKKIKKYNEYMCLLHFFLFWQKVTGVICLSAAVFSR